MSLSVAIESAPQKVGAPSPVSERLASLDAFRGLVILAMTLVNYLAGIKNIPGGRSTCPRKWKAPPSWMSCFPGFLFIVGVAIPLALHKRMARGARRRLGLS
jgi:heparan-alpha-glucosaminide N-acetyltransferase